MGIIVETDVSCDCTDWERHQGVGQTAKELEDRRRRAANIEVVAIRQKGAIAIAKTLTKESRDARIHEVILPSSGKMRLVGWYCKHIIAVQSVLNEASAA